MNHLIEYFHTLVEHKFKREQYEVFYNNGKFDIRIAVPDEQGALESVYKYSMYKIIMENCLKGFIKSENYNISINLPINIKKDYDTNYLSRLNSLLRVESNNGHT
jgi:hypothetical protein